MISSRGKSSSIGGGGQRLKPASSGIKNRTIFTADNLPVMRGMEDESVDLIYLDPPFNSKHNYAAPIGSKAAGVEFKDTWTLQKLKMYPLHTFFTHNFTS